MAGKTKSFTTLADNVEENVHGKFWIGSRLHIDGSLLVITRFDEPFMKDAHRVIRFYTEEVEAPSASADDKKGDGRI
jgi:hypothetical protein